MRLSSLLENDIAALETGHRGYLLTGNASYLEPFERRRELIKNRVEELAVLILEVPKQRKRVMKIQEIVQKWLDTFALPQMNGRLTKGMSVVADSTGDSSGALGSGLLSQARESLQLLQADEQIVLNERMREQEWAAQSTQILDFLTKLERSTIEMQKEKRGYLLTGENSFAEAYRRATGGLLHLPWLPHDSGSQLTRAVKRAEPDQKSVGALGVRGGGSRNGSQANREGSRRFGGEE